MHVYEYNWLFSDCTRNAIYIAFEEHMLNAFNSFGHTVGEAWYEMPIFYFTNHQAIYGPDDKII